MKYKCIIFDCDGVLVDSEGISNATLVAMAKSFGVSIEDDYANEFFLGKSLQFCFDYIERLSNQKLPSNFEEEFRLRTFQAFKTELKPIEGIHELLNKIKIPFCVASNGPAEKIRLNLTTTQLIDKFEGNIFSAYDINSWKPNPELYWHAAKSMGFEIQECVVIEDSPAGVQAALTGGFDVLGFVNKGNHVQLKQQNIQLFHDMATLDELLHMY
jgi:HAD superfamily hydrolase (TIGR01509 family)